MKRADFSPKVKEIIASRAAYRCSFPGCNATLIGPGVVVPKGAWHTFFAHEDGTVIFEAKDRP